MDKKAAWKATAVMALALGVFFALVWMPMKFMVVVMYVFVAIALGALWLMAYMTFRR